MLARETGLSLNVLRFLSEQPDTWTPIAVVATRLEISRAYAGKLCHRLQRAGYLLTQQGAAGGVQLSEAARGATLFDLAEALEDPFLEGRCLLLREQCVPDEPCPMHEIWSSIHSRTLEHFRDCPIADRADGGASASGRA